MQKRWRYGAAAAATLVVCSGSLFACEGSSSGAKVASVQSGPMPDGESWTGVYFHPVFGYLHLVEQGSNVIGKWERADKSAYGDLSGTQSGNVVHFTWKEHKYGQVGPSGESKGKGYFIYKMNADRQGELKGEYGLGDDETGSSWDCKKQSRMQPDLQHIGPHNSGTTTPTSGID